MSEEYDCAMNEAGKPCDVPTMPEHIEVPTAIVYKPHCGKCGFPIDTSEHKIVYQNVYEKATEVMLARKVGTNIYPNRCPHCGTVFESIEIPMPIQSPDIFLGE